MKKLLELLSSTKTSLVLLLLFTLAMAAATFVENSYDTVTAQILIYNAKWFELIMLLMALNFVMNLRRYSFFTWGKIPGLLFHLAFIIMIAGAAVTRYFGGEGVMHIREGEKSNTFLSRTPYFMVSAGSADDSVVYETPGYFTGLFSTVNEVTLQTASGKKIRVNCSAYVKNAIEQTEKDQPGGVNMIELVFPTFSGETKYLINDGDSIKIGSHYYSFNGKGSAQTAVISDHSEGLTITFPYNSTRAHMLNAEIIQKNTPVEFSEHYMYNGPDGNILFVGFYPSAKRVLVEGSDAGTPDGLSLQIACGEEKKDVTLWCSPQLEMQFREVAIAGTNVKIGYGQKTVDLPFSIMLNDFILERYPGSNSPSSFESKVVVSDTRNNTEEPHRIYMNNVLDYGGYRFFQSSYDQDEKGTVLSVNCDAPGTMLTYFSYFLLSLGLFLTLANRNSRFLSLAKLIKTSQAQRFSGLLLLIFFFSGFPLTGSSNPARGDVDKGHSDRFSQLVMQGNDGRFQPVHTLAYDVMHKISRKDRFAASEGKEVDAVQAFLGILVNPEVWKKKKIVYIREASVKEKLGLVGSHAAFDDFFDEGNNYILEGFVEKAFRKSPEEQSVFDKEIIKVDERMNILMMVMHGELLRIFPEQGSANNHWISYKDDSAFVPLEGKINFLNESMNLPVFNYNNIFRLYFTELIYAANSGKYERVDTVLSQLMTVQKIQAGEVFPSEETIMSEIKYNSLNVFGKLKNAYGILGLLLLIFAFAENIRSDKSRLIKISMMILVALGMVAFAFHTYGLALRWHITGHAPWSNGYETLVFVGWSGMLAGFCFMRFSKITVAATTILAFFSLMTAGHSSYDPQLTNLVPVLKSYWLIFHVAALAASYGFLGLGFILGIIILCVYLFSNEKNYSQNFRLINEWTYINEMNLTVGLVLATIGTFLGGIWANESWGRYWGWDAKETWALIIIIVYSMVLHLRLVPKLRSELIFNISAVVAFGSVLMTFFGVNYYFSKGLHSYASGETPVFPVWAWITFFLVILLFVAAIMKEKKLSINQHSGL